MLEEKLNVLEYLKYERDERAEEMAEDDPEDFNVTEWNEANPVFGKSDEELMVIIEEIFASEEFDQGVEDWGDACSYVWEVVCGNY
jgi:hypothetical protein